MALTRKLARLRGPQTSGLKDAIDGRDELIAPFRVNSDLKGARVEPGDKPEDRPIGRRQEILGLLDGETEKLVELAEELECTYHGNRAHYFFCVFVLFCFSQRTNDSRENKEKCEWKKRLTLRAAEKSSSESSGR